jgi:hypothetical protein
MTIVLYVIGLLVPVFVGALIVLAARRGPTLRIVGVEIINRKGELAGRARLVVRHFAAWFAPVALGLGISVVVLTRRTHPVGVGLVVLGLVLMAAGVVVGLRTPQRGLAERLSGTLVVPE